MHITKSDLIKIINRLAAEIELNCPNKIEIDDVDFYWDIIDSKESYNPYEEPKLALGQVTDQWQELSRLTDNKSVSFSYDLKRLSLILRLLEYKMGAEWFKQVDDVDIDITDL